MFCAFGVWNEFNLPIVDESCVEKIVPMKWVSSAKEDSTW